MSKTKIKSTFARKVWDSRGLPTIEVEVTLNYNAKGRATAPSGRSIGTGEAVEIRDGGMGFKGFGVNRSIETVNSKIAPLLKGKDASNQVTIDKLLIDLDNTADKSCLGSNAMIATSIAIAKATADAMKMPLWQYLHENENTLDYPTLPLPEVEIFGGGAHANKRVDVQSYMVTAIGAETFNEALEWSASVYHAATNLMELDGKLMGVSDEGGLWPEFKDNEQALEFLLRAIESAGLTPGQDIAISLDIAASQFGSKNNYYLLCDGRELNSDELSGLLVDWTERYPIISIEDPMAEGDKEGFVRFTWAVGKKIQVIGDDFLVTKASRIKSAARDSACNAVMIKPNQAGTLTETRKALKAAVNSDLGTVISTRSGETEDVSVIHIAVGWSIEQLKIGSITRGERTAKWNEGLRIAESLNNGGRLRHIDRFSWRNRA